MAAKKKSTQKKTRTSGRRSWTEKELATLGKMAATRPVGLIAYELDRTEAAVRNKAHTEGISFRSPERSPYGKPAATKRKAARKKK